VACSTAKAVEWDASWSKNLDPSGRAALGVHDAAYKDTPGEAPASADPVSDKGLHPASLVTPVASPTAV
jgi:asparagine synthase (glutamine-hydrolysing)